MAKDIKVIKGNSEMTINETQLDSFINLGWKQEKENTTTIKKENKKWQHITEKKES